MSGIFEAFLSTPNSQQLFGERSLVAAMLRFEAELARAQADCGLLQPAVAETIAACCHFGDDEVAQVVAHSGRAGSVAIPLVQILRERVAARDPLAAASVHLGSTSQDVIDTGLALVMQQAWQGLETDLHQVVEALLQLADAHAATPVMARTLMQPASVTSFGHKCLAWAMPLVRARQRLQRSTGQALCVQLGGAAGTRAQLDALQPGAGQAVAQALALRLRLALPDAVWHTQRDQWVGLGCELGLLAGSLGKIARDLALMGQFEVGEIAEPSEAGRGGSSAMPHKRNPVASMVALAAAQRAPQLVATLLAAMPQEHERALGPWQAELATWPLLWGAVLGSARALAQALPGLLVDAGRMRANIEALRQVLPAQAADEWFRLDMAEALAPQVLAEVRAQAHALRQV